MPELYKVDSPITREQRNNLNATFQDILNRFTNLRYQISILAGGEDLEAVLQRIEDAIANANNTTANTQQVLDDISDALAQLSIALQNSENATNNANDAATNAQNEITAMQNFVNQLGNAESYDNSKTYFKNNIVEYNGSSYIALQQTTGNTPPVLPNKQTAFWQLIAQRGVDGAGSVSSVNGISPDVNGNVQLTPGNIGAATEMDLTNLSQSVSTLSTEVTNHLDNIAQRAINVKFPPHPLVAAVGDETVDDTEAIQALIDYASSLGKATLFFPKGIYRITSTLMYKEGVSFLGDNGSFTSRLKWDSQSSGYILDTRNVTLALCSIEKMAFTSYNHVGSGIFGGSTFANYNAFNMRFKDVLFHGLNVGLDGAGVSETEDPRAIGIFDSYFENVWFSDCATGMVNGGSGNMLINPRFSGCINALVKAYASPESSSGIQVLGGVFAANSGYDIVIEESRGIRNSMFLGTWFESSGNGIINVPFADSFLSTLTFKNCQINSYATQFGLMNFYNAVGAITIENCILTQTLANQDMAIVKPNNLANGTVLKISDTILAKADGTRTLQNHSYYDDWKGVTYQNGWVDVATSARTKYTKDDSNIVHLHITMKDGLATANSVIFQLPEGFRPNQTVRFDIFDATAQLPRQMYLQANGNLAIQEVAGQTLTTGAWSGYITFKADA